jgi:poly(A) polymerase
VTDDQDTARSPRVVPRSEHRISRANISDNALKVLYRLKAAGYEAYLVGGGVRDLSLGHEPKDFDVATDARPEAVKELFRNCRLIGRRFRLAHVHFGPEIIEVATFRALHDPDGGSSEERIIEDGLIVRDNVYGTLAEDALRRDFTINALYYNIADFSVVDHAGGMEDLEAGVVRLIGDPEVRYREDPVRMLRAVRFAVKLGFKIDPGTARPIRPMAELLQNIPTARLFEESLKLFMSGTALESFEALRHYGLFDQLFPGVERALARDAHGVGVRFISLALKNTDDRIADGKPVTPTFLFAALLWPAVREAMRGYQDQEGMNDVLALQAAAQDAVQDQLRRVAIPKRFSIPMREVWSLQPRLERRGGRRSVRLIGHPRFRAAYDFMLLRAEVDEVAQDVAAWWRDFQSGSEEERQTMAENDAVPARRRRRRRKKPSAAQE